MYKNWIGSLTITTAIIGNSIVYYKATSKKLSSEVLFDIVTFSQEVAKLGCFGIAQSIGRILEIVVMHLQKFTSYV
jgi:hypothetical protein